MRACSISCLSVTMRKERGGWWWVPASVIEGVIADAVITGSGGPGDVVAGAFDEAGDGDPAGED